MRRASSWISAAALAAIALGAEPARANGRFPESNQIAFSAEDPDLVLLRVTFGLLVSHDRGKTFEWVCEQSIGFSGIEDPMYTVTPSKSIVGTTFQGLTVSRNGACGWSFVSGELDNQVFIDLTTNPTDAKNIVVFASSYDKQDSDGNILFTSRLWETKDEANTFQQLGQPLDPALLGYTVDLTATDPERIYVTAVRSPGVSPRGFLLVSKDHGKTWTEEEVPLVGTERAVFVAAVDPTNAERVYLRTSNTVDKPTRLILREGGPDGGAPTQRTLHTAKGALAGFALTPDGSRIYIGGPKDGVLAASAQDYVFAQKANIETQCLAVGPDGLWACSNERSGFVAGLSKDDGATFEARVRFCDIGGPLTSCGPGTPTNDICAPNWPAQKALLGCGGLDGGAGGGDGGFGAGPGFPPPPPPKGCDCQASPAGTWMGAVVSAGAGLIALVRRARRRRG
ncbi:MAG: hypothetical protein KF764_19020 [Labilithrix sp.]|nr:hypothetical protein [Labilithrix sp.]MBX3224908.1 hypothetical protein [Labilithrix sp.]